MHSSAPDRILGHAWPRRPARVIAPAAVRGLVILVIALFAMLGEPIAAAQSGSTPTPGSGSGGSGAGASGPGPGAGSARGAIQASDFKIELERLGVGGWARPGSWTGFRLRVNDAGATQRDVVVRLEMTDPDGDTALVEREVTTNPGVWQGVWLYAQLPHGAVSGTQYLVSAYERPPSEAAPTAAVPTPTAEAAQVGRLLARVPIALSNVINPFDSIIGIVSTNSGTMGLQQYGHVTEAGAGTYDDREAPAGGHELTKVLDGLRAAELPDRWMGYAGFEALVWASDDPSRMTGDSALAIRRWVERGGHFIVIMPSTGQAWTNPKANELLDLIPAVTIQTREGVDLAAYRELFTRRSNVLLPKDAVVHTFVPRDGAKPAEAMRILNGPGGECVVARRLVGAGMVTLIGIDMAKPSFAAGDFVSAEVFWHRVLGRRGEVRSPSTTSAAQLLPPPRQEVSFDSDIGPAIAKNSRSAAGVLLGMTVFIVYWLVAGPVGYALLKRMKLVKHAWVAFLASAALFTAIAWGGATLIRPSRVEATHLTLLDHVYGQPLERARSWVSVLIPWYGSARLEVGDPPAAGDLAARTGSDAIWAWDEPRTDRGVAGSFPDARAYEIEARAPRSITVPTRSTVKQVQIDWAGGPLWQMPTPRGATPDDSVLRLGADGQVIGTLMHELPGAIEDVVIVVVPGQKDLGISIGRQMITDARAFKLAQPWAASTNLDLAETTKKGDVKQDTSAAAYFKMLTGQGIALDAFGQTRSTTGDIAGRLAALAFFSQLAPPEVTTSDHAQVLARRVSAHTYDLGRWFTQPCVIIVGQVVLDEKHAEAGPIPLKVDGEPVRMGGRTVIRWVYPLGEKPPAWPAEASQAPAAPEKSGGK